MLPHPTGGGVNFQAAIGPVTSHFRALCASENYTKADPRLINKEAHGGSYSRITLPDGVVNFQGAIGPVPAPFAPCVLGRIIGIDSHVDRRPLPPAVH